MTMTRSFEAFQWRWTKIVSLVAPVQALIQTASGEGQQMGAPKGALLMKWHSHTQAKRSHSWSLVRLWSKCCLGRTRFHSCILKCSLYMNSLCHMRRLSRQGKPSQPLRRSMQTWETCRARTSTKMMHPDNPTCKVNPAILQQEGCLSGEFQVAASERLAHASQAQQKRMRLVIGCNLVAAGISQICLQQGVWEPTTQELMGQH